MRLDIKSYKGGKQNLHVNRPGRQGRARYRHHFKF
jgi:hypothetical protein